MIERKKLETPTSKSLSLEADRENVTIVGQEEMERRIEEVVVSPEYRAIVTPVFMKYAGSRMPASKVPDIILEVIRVIIEDQTSNIRFFAVEFGPKFIEVVLSDAREQEKVRSFLREALSG